jgi:hypothetical protein
MSEETLGRSKIPLGASKDREPRYRVNKRNPLKGAKSLQGGIMGARPCGGYRVASQPWKTVVEAWNIS